MERSFEISFNDLPNEPLGRRAQVLQTAIPYLVPRTLTFMRDTYSRAPLLKECVDFVAWHLLDAPPAFLENLAKVWYFPWAEASKELDQVLTACMLTMYKAAYDHLRRSLELVVVGSFFTMEKTPTEKAHAWMVGEDGTPRFARTIERLIEEPHFCDLEERRRFGDSLKELYWSLSDITHVRGIRYGFERIQPLRTSLGACMVPEFDKTALANVLDRYIDVVRHIATIIAAANPVLLVGLDMELKFGFNGPVSGFFDETQADLLHRLILDDCRSVLDDIVEKDAGIRSLISWYESTPDITPEELQKQAEQQDQFFEQHRWRGGTKERWQE